MLSRKAHERLRCEWFALRGKQDQLTQTPAFRMTEEQLRESAENRRRLDDIARQMYGSTGALFGNRPQAYPLPGSGPEWHYGSSDGPLYEPGFDNWVPTRGAF